MSKYTIQKVGLGNHTVCCPAGVWIFAGRWCSDDPSPIDGVSDWHRVNRLVDDANMGLEARAELTRLREIEAAARAAGQITRDGKFARLGMKVWHPKHAEPSECFIEHPEDGFAIEIEEGEQFFYYPVSECYSTPEAAQAAKEGKP